MVRSFSNALAFLLLLLPSGMAVAQTPQGPALGHKEPGAPTLSGYIVSGKLCIPLKRFATESGYEMNVSPNGRHVAIMVGSKLSVLFNAQRARVDNKEFPLTIKPVERNNDFYVEKEFFEKAYPVRFTFNPKTNLLTAELPGKTLKIPMRRLPPQKQ